MVETLSIAIIASVLSMIAPGPNMVAVASTALGSGRRKALAVAAGVSIGTMGWVFFAAFGFGALLAAQPAMLSFMKIFGGAYLLWLAVRILWSMRNRSSEPVANRDDPQGLFRHFLFGVMVVAANPKALLLWASVSTFLFGAGFPALWVALFGPAAAVLSFLNYGAYAFAFSSKFAKSSVGRSATLIDSAAGACFGWFGSKLLMDGLRELRT